MTEAPTTSAGLRAAAARARAFRALYRIVLALEGLFALALITLPLKLAPLLALTDAAADRLWGATLLVVALLQLPGLLSPIHARLTVIAGVIGRGLLALAFLLLGLWLPGLAALAAAAALSASFTRLVYAEIGSKP